MSSQSPQSSQRPTRAQQRLAKQAELAAARAAEARRRRIMNLSVVVVMVLLFAGVAVVAFSNRGGPTVDAGGEAYVSDPTAFRLPGLLDDQTVSLQDHAGRPVVVNFFASWCVYCNVELPGFVQVAKATAGQVDFIGVDSSDPGDGGAMAERFDLSGAGFSLARDIGASPPSDLWASFGSQGLPVTAFYDGQGRMVDFSGGMLTQSQLELILKTDFGITVSAPDAAALGSPVIPLIPRGAYELLGRNAGDPGYVALDIRPASRFADNHVPTAVNVEVGDGSLPEGITSLDRTASFFLYDESGDRVDAVATEMHDAGFLHVYYVQGGFAAWVQAGLPTSS